MTTITCPCCDGTGGPTVDGLGSMEPAQVTGCHVCHGTHYIDTVVFTKAMLLETTDIYEAAGKAASDIPSSVAVVSRLEVIEDASNELRKCGIGDASRQDELHEIIMDHAEALATALAEAEARADRWKRMALARDAYEDALLFGLDGNEQERVREELRAAHTDLKAHGDLGDES